ncbi:MAG: hypothetical protein ACM3WU_07545 [Bacillota bacterium]
MRTRKNLLFAGILVMGGVLLGWFGKGLAAGDPVLPGSEEDPLVSRSYVHSYVGTSVDDRMKMVVVEVPAGKKLIGSAGTEIIVRSGSATAIDTQSGGLSDVTAGVDLRKGDIAPANHLLIVPRDDGRGIAAVTSLFVMVRGAYTLQ